jgi:phenylalanyl-tRNA synthetase beta chain
MAILTISKKQFEKEVGKLDNVMQEQIAMFGTPIEALTDEEIQIELFPNRPDLLSYHNFRNSFLSYLGKKTGLRKIKLNKPCKDYEVKIESSVKSIRPYTACAIVKNLKFDEAKIKEIIDIQEKLHITVGRNRKKMAIGVYPLEKIKLPITYKALDPEKIIFQPLEFSREINGKQILSQHPAGRDYGHLLEDCDKYPVFVDANNKVLSMPPVINSHKTGKITSETKDVFIECSGFDLNVLKKVLNILVYAFSGMGGDVYQMKLKYNKSIITPDIEPEKMKLSLENTNKLLGLELKEKEVKKFLERMGYDYSNGNVKIPAYRTDILHEVDLIEDIAIAYGYDKFIPEIPEVATSGEIDRKEVLKSKMSDILTGLSFVETNSLHLINKDTIKKLKGNTKGYIKVLNSKSEYEFLRQNLSSYIFKILSENVDVEYPQEIFQIGKVFEGYDEKERLAIAITPGNFTKLKQVVEYFGRMLDIKFDIANSKEFPNYFIEGRVAEIKFNNKSIGFIGEIHPKILTNFRIKMPVSLLEINIDDILENHPK